MLEKRAVLFIVVSMVVLFLYMMTVSKLGLMPPPPKDVLEKMDKAGLLTDDNDHLEPEVTAVKPQLFVAANAVSVAEDGLDRLVTEKPLSIIPERETVVETDLYRAVFSNRGGVIKRWELKRYTDKNNGPVVLFDGGQQGPDSMPFAIMDESGTGVFNMLTFNQDGEGGVVSNRQELSFYTTQNGITIRKTYTFNNGTYQLGVRIETTGLQTANLSLGNSFGLFDTTAGGRLNVVGPLAMVDEEIQKYKVADLEATTLYKGAVSWIALQDKYFLAALLPDNAAGQLTVIKDSEDRPNLLIAMSGGVDTLTLYAGPKEKKQLDGTGLESTLNFGYFIFGTWNVVAYIANGLFFLLKGIFAITRNYGVAIILLTTLVKMVLFPLTHKQFKSMKAMQQLQPKIKKLQAKYKNDKQQLNLEMMQIYKEHGVNPMSGCFPLVLQMPIFIALYNLLYTAIELRHSPFVFWLTDLSVKDPYYVLPVIMGISMLVQQKMQPTQVDATQAKLMMLMPIVFTFMFLNFPSGLVLYWLTNNLLTIFQQKLTQRLEEGNSRAVTV